MIRNLFDIYREYIRKRFPNHKLHIHRVKMEDDGTCQEIGDEWHIKINKDRTDLFQIDILSHEMAHVLSKEIEHNKQWAEAYGTIYRIYEGWCDE